MKMKTKLIAIGVLVTAGWCNAQAQMDTYAYSRKVQEPYDTWHKIVLPNTVTAQMRADMSDIRLYGITSAGDTVEAPYMLDVKSATVDRQLVPHEIINEGRKGNTYYYTVRLAKPSAINMLKLHFAEQNYDRTVTVEGSTDQKEWFTIAEDYRITAIRQADVDFEYATVLFPKATYTYYRLAVEAASKPTLKRVESVNYETAQSNYQTQPIASQQTYNVADKKQTVVDIDLTGKAPVSRITIPVQSAIDYYRPATIMYAVDSVQVADGYRYIYNSLSSHVLSSERDAAAVTPQTMVRKLRIIIYNDDNQPLTIGPATVQGYPIELIARIDQPADYQLAYGNKNAERPRYDIRRFGDKVPADIKPLKLGPSVRTAKSTVDDAPLLDSQLWLWLVMGVSISLLGIFAIRMITEKKGQEQNKES